DEACIVLGDATQLKQVFVNLMQNAIEAMQKDGRVAIFLNDFSRAVHGAERGLIEVRVEDEGPGIAPDKVARIFDPFYTEKESGVGMGLAICLRLITAHDGSIQAAARPGGGAAMIVRLPIARAGEVESGT